MERLILDTTVLVSAERSTTGVIDVVGDDDDVAIAAITLAELLVGVRLASGKRRTARAAYVDAVAGTLNIEDYTASVAAAHADLLAHVWRQGRPRGAHDLIIAATATATDRTLVTADARGFDDLPGLSMRSVSAP